MDELAKQFFKAMVGREYHEERDGNSFSQHDAKAAAALCRSKWKEAIELAREKADGFNPTYDHPATEYVYLKSEIIDKLSLNK